MGRFVRFNTLSWPNGTCVRPSCLIVQPVGPFPIFCAGPPCGCILHRAGLSQNWTAHHVTDRIADLARRGPTFTVGLPRWCSNAAHAGIKASSVAAVAYMFTCLLVRSELALFTPLFLLIYSEYAVNFKCKQLGLQAYDSCLIWV